MIDNRFTIEYIQPKSPKGSEKKKISFLLAFLGFVIITTLAYGVFSTNKKSQLIEATSPQKQKSNSQFTQLAATDINSDSRNSNTVAQQKNEKIFLINYEEASKSPNQLVTDIKNLTKQLMAEREKYKALDKQLNSQKNENNQLSELLETALFKASKTDKNYLNALSKLDKKIKSDKVINLSQNNNKQSYSKIKTVAVYESSPNKENDFNRISLSTNSQIDAIIATMQSTATLPQNTSKVIKINVDKTREVQLASISKKNPTELLHIKLQHQIDQIINKGKDGTKNNKAYNKSLEKESTVRNNAVRFITVNKGDTLWSIAQRAYENGDFYKQIIDANPQVDLENIYIGQIIRVPK